MSETKGTKRTKSIAFRLTDEEYAQAESAASAAGEDPNSWCRKVALIQLNEGFGLTKNDQLLYEEIARMRYMVGHGFRLLLNSKEATAAAWKKITADADQSSGIIADDLLSRRR
ncbi:MAG: hypothetical protein H0U60_10870 [Blastocatellia bacterium]|nr:hypothetical protein [Blastocatellia bacterium]